MELSQSTVRTRLVTPTVHDGVTRCSNSSIRMNDRLRGLAAARLARLTGRHERFHSGNQQLRNMRNLLVEKRNQERHLDTGEPFASNLRTVPEGQARSPDAGRSGPSIGHIPTFWRWSR